MTGLQRASDQPSGRGGRSTPRGRGQKRASDQPSGRGGRSTPGSCGWSGSSTPSSSDFDDTAAESAASPPTPTLPGGVPVLKVGWEEKEEVSRAPATSCAPTRYVPPHRRRPSPYPSPQKGSDDASWRRGPDESPSRSDSGDRSRRRVPSSLLVSASDSPSWRHERDNSPPLPSYWRENDEAPPSPNPVSWWRVGEEVPFPSSGRVVPDPHIVPDILGRVPAEMLQHPHDPSALLPTEIPESWRGEIKSFLQTSSEAWRDSLVDFLNSFKLPNHSCALYKAEVTKLKLLGFFNIEVDFDHLLSAHQDLAFIICNGQGRVNAWLSQAANKFLGQNGVNIQEGTITFINIPTSIKRARDAFCTASLNASLIIENRIFSRSERSLIVTFGACQLLDALISGLFNRPAKCEAWCGTLSFDEIIFVERNEKLELMICQEPVVKVGSSGEERLLDVHGLWSWIEPFFLSDGEMPVYFEQLKKDLKDATAEDVTSNWFEEYLKYHPSLMPSMGRRNFESGLYQLRLRHRLLFKPLFDDLPGPLDWRLPAVQDAVLKKVYTHDFQKQGEKRVTEASTDKQ